MDFYKKNTPRIPSHIDPGVPLGIPPRISPEISPGTDLGIFSGAMRKDAEMVFELHPLRNLFRNS